MLDYLGVSGARHSRRIVQARWRYLVIALSTGCPNSGPYGADGVALRARRVAKRAPAQLRSSRPDATDAAEPQSLNTPVAARLLEALAARWPIAARTPSDADVLYESLLEWSLSAGNDGLSASPSSERRRAGAHYTPPALATQVAQQALAPLLIDLTPQQLLSLRICDPACGSGALLAACRDVLLAALPREAAEEYGNALAERVLHGIDCDRVAVELARQRLPGARILAANALAQGSETPEERWSSLFPDVMAAGGFDAIIGNPPWIAYVGRASQPLSQPVSAQLRRTYESFQRYKTLHGVFIEHATYGLRPEGRLGLVVPTSVADLEGYGPTRSAHDARCETDRPLLDFGDGAFNAVMQPCMALTSTRRSTGSRPGQAAWQLASTRLAAPEQAMLDKLRRLPGCPSGLFGERGYQTVGADRTKLVPVPAAGLPPGFHPILTGTEVRPFERLPARLCVAPDTLMGRLREASEWRQVAVLIRQTARVPLAALGNGQPFRNSVLAAFVLDGFNPFLLLGYLNSTPIRWFHFHRFRDARQGMPQMKISHLRALPSPPTDNTDAGAALTRLCTPIAQQNLGLSAAAQERLDACVGQWLGLDTLEQARMNAWARSNPPVPSARKRAASAEVDTSLAAGHSELSVSDAARQRA